MLVQTHELTKRYGSLTALDHCTLSVARGEAFGLLGPNGAGKTTLLRTLLGYLQPTAGWAKIADHDCYRDSVAVHRVTSYLPGEARLFPQMNGREVLKFFARVRGNPLARSLQLAERLELDISRQVRRMSTGMRQKLALAAALAAETPLVILDEPTSNLDPNVRGEVAAIVRDARQAGRTVLFSSHVLSEVEETCDRVAILRAGQLVHLQVIAELRQQHRIRARLTGRLVPPPESLRDQLSLWTEGDALQVETPGELSKLLPWLGTLPLAEVHIEPIRLQAIYDRFHGRSSAATAVPTANRLPAA